MDRLLYFGNGLTSIKEDIGSFIKPNKALKMVFGVRSIRVYSGTCVLWTPWDQPKVSRLSRCPDFPGQFI